MSQLRKFRVAIYVDIFVPEYLGEIEKDRKVAKVELDNIIQSIPNSFSNGNVVTLPELINNPDLI